MIYHITSLHEELKAKTYRHGGYEHFRISDPKPRDIHKASVRDRLLHHAIYRKLYPYCDIRYADDFVVLSCDRAALEQTLRYIVVKLSELKLQLHPDKVFIQNFASGVDFLGWVHFPDHRVLRTSTKRRMLRRLNQNPTENVQQSYLRMLQHGNTKKLQAKVLLRL